MCQDDNSVQPVSARFSDDELRTMAAHVCYERGQLIALISLVPQTDELISKATEDQRARSFYVAVLNNALTESALLHVRVLDEFLGVAARKRPDDVIALDYCPDPKHWDPTPFLSAEMRTMIDKKLAHMTTERLNQQPWVLSKLLDDAMNGLTAFLNSLPTKQQGWFAPPAPTEIV